MEKNNQPLIITAIIGGIVLIIALAFIFTRNSDETTTTTDANNTTENGTNGGGSQPPAPTPAPTPTPTPQPAPTPTPNPTPAPDPQPSVLPANWDSLTRQEKTDLNPFDCDYDSQWVSAEDGTCINKEGEQPISCTALIPECGYYESCPDYQITNADGDCVVYVILSIGDIRCNSFVDMCRRQLDIAVGGNPNNQVMDAIFDVLQQQELDTDQPAVLDLNIYRYIASDDLADYSPGDLLKKYFEEWE